MASRMEKYHNKISQFGNRSYRNRFLYQEIEKFLENNNLSFNSSLDKENKINLNKLEGLFNDYEQYRYKHGKIINDFIDKQDAEEDLEYTSSITSKVQYNDIENSKIKNDIGLIFNEINNELKSQDKKNISIKDDYVSNKKNAERKFNLKIKKIVIFLFIINSILIIFLIYNFMK